jgi:hypothetical protein
MDAWNGDRDLQVRQEGPHHLEVLELLHGQPAQARAVGEAR